MKKISYLCYLIIILALISTCIGIFYTTNSNSLTVKNTYGENVNLYGDGIYKYDSVLKAGANKGTDLAMFFVVIFFAYFTINSRKSEKYRFWQVGFLASLLYYSFCLVFSVTFNRLFLIYVLLFSSCLFTIIFLLSKLVRDNILPKRLLDKNLKGTALFLIICGSSVLLWLEFIVPALINGQPLSNIEIYTTEPTFVLDLGIVLPVYWCCGIALLKKKEIGYKLAPILLTFIMTVGLTVIGQNIFQSTMGIEIPIEQFFALVITFVVLGVIAVILNLRFFQYLKDEN